MRNIHSVWADYFHMSLRAIKKGGSFDPAFFACGAGVLPVVVQRCRSVAAPLLNSNDLNQTTSGVAASLPEKEVISIFSFIHFEFHKQQNTVSGSQIIIDPDIFFVIMAGGPVWNNSRL